MDKAVVVDGLWEAFQTKTRRGYRRRQMRWALQDISFTIDRGEVVGVIGGNGSGKSTLLQCIAGVLTPTRGVIETRGRVGSLVDLSAGFHRELTGRENVLIGGVLAGLTRKETAASYERIVQFAEIEEETMNTPAFTYSAGMLLRLGLSILLHSDAQVMVIDEVLAVADASFRTTAMEAIRTLRAEGRAFTMVSHDPDLIEATCDQVLILDHGKAHWYGPPREAVERYASMTPGSTAQSVFPVQSAWQRTEAARRQRRRRL
jgi:lipopolysaccharide transport system ATP-binding protein